MSIKQYCTVVCTYLYFTHIHMNIEFIRKINMFRNYALLDQNMINFYQLSVNDNYARRQIVSGET